MDGSQETSVAAAEAKAPKVATLQELEANFPKAGDSFYVACMRSKMTVDQARQAYIAKIETDAAEMSAENARLKVEAEKAKTREPVKSTTSGKSGIGVDPVGDGGRTVPDAKTAFLEVVDKEMAVCRDRPTAVKRAVAKYPDLHQAYLVDANQGRK